MHCLEVIISMNERGAKEQLARKNKQPNNWGGTQNEIDPRNLHPKQPRLESRIPKRQIRIQ